VGQSSGIVHSFAESLEYSAGLSDEPSWVEFYQRLWPDMANCVRVDRHGDGQRHGIDRIVIRANGQQHTIDEKKRTKDYGDVLLEEWSVFYREADPRNRIGWTLDANKRCDFIAYAIPSAKKCYLLPFELLRQAFYCNRSDWMRRFPRKEAQNNGYVTVNVALPWGDLKAAIVQQMVRKFAASGLALPTASTDDGLQITFEYGFNVSDGSGNNGASG